MQKEESSERGERDARQGRKGVAGAISGESRMKRIARSDKGFRASDCRHVFRAPEDKGGAGAWEAIVAIGNFNRWKLSRSVSRAEQS